jgi:opacity protein-like surface antigen
MPCAHAADDVYDFELTPFGAYRFGGEFDVTGTDSTLGLADSPSYGLLMNFRQHANTQWEILYSRQQTDASAIGAPVNSSALDVDIHTLQGGGTYQGDGDTVRPYLAATLGGTHMKTSSEGAQSDTFFSFSLGVGLQIRPNDRLGLRLEARSYGILTDSKTDLFCATGPDQNICAIRIDGTVLWQLETMVGIVFRF